MLDTLKAFAVRVFGKLPGPVRRTLVSLTGPSFTAGTVALIERDDGRVLFVRPAYRQDWAFPGGLLERGESPEPAIHRELREELELVIVLEPDPWVLLDSRRRRLDVVWRARTAPGVDADAIEVTSYELVGADWFDLDDPPPLEDEASDILEVRRRHLDTGETVFFF